MFETDENAIPLRNAVEALKADCLKNQLQIVLNRKNGGDASAPPPLGPSNSRVETKAQYSILASQDSPLKCKIKRKELLLNAAEPSPPPRPRSRAAKSSPQAASPATPNSRRNTPLREARQANKNYVLSPESPPSRRPSSRRNSPAVSSAKSSPTTKVTKRSSRAIVTPPNSPPAKRSTPSSTSSRSKGTPAALKAKRAAVSQKRIKYDDSESSESEDEEDIEDELGDDVSDRTFHPDKNKKVEDYSDDDDDDISDLDEETPKKRAASAKKRGTKTPKKGPATPSRKIMTPSMPKRSKMLPESLSPIQEAQFRLHVSAVPDSLPCRENEFAEIFSFTEGKILEGTGGCMYISGWPGTGKTATVMEVVRTLTNYAEMGEVPKFNFIEINAMRLTEPNQAYVQLWKKMNGGEKVTSDHALALLDAKFKSPKTTKTTVLLIDELDMLCNRKQSVLYNLFEWPTRATSKLVVLAIANAMDLPERVMINRVSSRLGLTRLTFSPYTFQQLQEIVITRLQGLKVFDKDAIQLVARKVASLSGDARRALDICRRATEIAQRESEKNTSATSNKKKSKAEVLVGISHVLKAHEEMFCSPKIVAIRSCSKYEKLLLRSIIFCFQKSGLEETSFERVYDMLTDQMSYEKVRLNTTQVYKMVFGLSGCRILIAEAGKLGPQLRIRLNVSQDDVLFALDSGTKD